MKKTFTRLLVSFLLISTTCAQTALAQTTETTLQAQDLIPTSADIILETNTKITNPLYDSLTKQVNTITEIGSEILELAKDNIVTIALDNTSTAASTISMTMEMTPENFTKILKTTNATEIETYEGIKIYNFDNTFYSALIQNLFVMASTPEQIKTMINNQIKSSNTLASSIPYTSLSNHDLPDSFIKLYFNPTIFMEHLGKEAASNDFSIENIAKNTPYANLIRALDGIKISANQNDHGLGFEMALHADSAKLETTGLNLAKNNFTPSLYQMLSGKDLIYYQEKNNLSEQISNALQMPELTQNILDELNNLKTEFKKETQIDFDQELLPLLNGQYMITLHNTNQLLPAVTAIFKVSDTNKAGKIALKFSQYLQKKLNEQQTNAAMKFFSYNISSAGGTSFYDFTIYLKSFDDYTPDTNQLDTLTDEATTIHLRFAVTTDNYLVISTLPDLESMFRKNSAGLLDNTKLKTIFTNPSSQVNEVAYLDLDAVHQYIDILMNFFNTDKARKTAINKVLAPWHALLIRSYATKDSIWLNAQLNMDTSLLSDFAENISRLMTTFNSNSSHDFENDTKTMTPSLNKLSASKKFCDVSANDWFYPYINDLSSKNIITGYSDGCFHPSAAITRAEFVKMAMKALNKATTNIPNGYQPFKDVPPNSGDWYSKDVNMAAMLGYIKGYDDGTFGPNNTITRAEAIKILFNMSNTLKTTPIQHLPNPFIDVQHTDWFYIPVITASSKRALTGTTPDHFEPNRALNRAEAAKIIKILMDIEES